MVPPQYAHKPITFNYFSAIKNLPRLGTSIVHQLLRSLGRGVDWNLLKTSIEYMAGR